MRLHALFVMLFLLLTACAAPPPTLTPVPTSTATPPPSPTPTITASPSPEVTPTETPIPVEIEPLAGEGAAPPLTLALPTGWRLAYDTLALPDVDGEWRPVPVAIYRGPVPGGEGTIVLFWGFPNLLAFDLSVMQGLTTPTPNLWSDGLRLFRLAMVEEGCNPGTDIQREYTVGGLPATGTEITIIDCPASPDTRGWFAGLQAEGINFVFFAYIEPIESVNAGRPALQAILDSVAFTVDGQ